MIFNSIRWRLQIWHGLLLLTVLAGFGYTAYRLQYANELRRVDQDLQQRLGPLLEALRRGPPGERGGPGGPGGPGRPGGLDDRGRGGPPEGMPGEFPPPRELRLGPGRAALFEGDTNAFFYMVWSRDGRELNRSASAAADVSRPARPSRPGLAPTMRLSGSSREIYQFTPLGECILVGRSIANELAGLRHFALVLSVLGSGVLILGLAGGWWMANRAIRPIDQISAAAAKIATGDLSHRINMDQTDNELGQLAAVLNSTFARLDSAFARQQQFTADASHELRTPIAVILSQTQATLARDRSNEEYRQTLEACQRAAQRMRRLTESLLALARLDAGKEPLREDTHDLSAIVSDGVELIQPFAVQRGIRIHADFSPAAVRGDADRLTQVVNNLLTNAIDYNHDGGEVRVTVTRDDQETTLAVWNTGPGVPSEELPHIFDRFHRADKVRSNSGHSGLGLAIAKAIVEAHGGRITAQSDPVNGTTILIRFEM